MDYRSLPDERTKQFQDYLQYAFSPEKGPQDDHDWDPDEQPGEARALFSGDEMLCVCRHYWFRVRLRGRWHEMPGLSAVASPPEHRRKGHIERLLVESLAEYRERGDYLTALWAFKHPFYAKYGWGLCQKFVEYDCSPDVLTFARDSASGEFRRLEADDYEQLEPVLAAHGEAYELAMEYSEQWWRKRVFEAHNEDPYVYAWADDDGEVRGYLVYWVKEGDDGKRLFVRDHAYADEEAYLNLLRFCANHDSQVETIKFFEPNETTLFDRVDDPAELNCEVKPGPMVRLVDVPAAIEALDYSDVTGEFTLSVTDPLAEWNDRTFRVVVESGLATCEPIDASVTTDADADPEPEPDADVRTNVSTLSQLYVGYHSVADATTLGTLEVADSTVEALLAAIFPARPVFLREGF
ncbi:GNAT family N-acetyltransferase [Halorussus halophilus]|uniref:GNAT family N-acetyltransferase n=1 Tax=Halorussus halophilus TaxID=2650975 RepID=UPI001300F23A|nr:GNAT family N-acetyltransferase [Halorussus halophilus]